MSRSYMRVENYIKNIEIYGPNQKKLRRLLSIGVNAILLHPELQYHMVAVGLTKSKEVILGYPKIKTHPFFKKYHEKYFNYAKAVHAEGDLTLKTMDKVLDTILVIRLGKKRNNIFNFFKLAKPCVSCQNVLADFQPQAKIYYTTNEASILPFIH